jgi:double-stranded uracil-DNA glycosylase
VIAPGLDVLFCGINPSLISAERGHHFARPGNRFWRVLHGAGFTDRLLSPFEEGDLLRFSVGITNLVNRATATAAGVASEELIRGVRALEVKARRYEPRYVAVLGLTAYRTAFGRAKASIGPQEETLGPSKIWLLPNPSGLNAHYQVPELIALFSELRGALGPRAAPDLGDGT